MTTLITTPRLILRRTDAADERAVHEFFVRNVDHLRRWLPEAEPIVRDPAFAAALQQRSLDELRAGREERWFVFLAEQPDRCVGYVFMTRFRRDGHHSCELSNAMDASLVGKGLMREAMEAAIQHAHALGFSRIDGRFNVDNQPMARLAERLGFTRIGVAPQHCWVDGGWRDHVLMTRVQRPTG